MQHLKKNFPSAVLGQELLLHQAPLLLLMIYNNFQLGKSYDDSDLSIGCLVSASANILVIALEFIYHRIWMNRSINPERR